MSRASRISAALPSSSSRRYRRYAASLLGLAVVLVLAVAACNAVVDPLSLLGLADIAGVNRVKTEIGSNGGRRGKAAAIASGRFDTLLLGTSRMEVGIDPAYAAFGGRNAYNAGLSGTNMYEIYEVFQFARRTMHPRAVVLGLDFLAFSAARQTAGDFDLSAFAGPAVLPRYLFSQDTLRLSWRTLESNRRGRQPTYDARGSSRYFESQEPVDHRRLFVSILRDNFFVNPETYAGFRYASDRVDLLGKLVEDCLADGIGIYLYISPVHARQLEALRAMDLYESFERWKRDLLETVANAAGRAEGGKAPTLWDFSGYSTLTTEPVPGPGQRDVKMRWYWESSHFKKALGNLVLDRLLGHAGEVPVPADFGVALQAEGLDAHLAAIRSAGERYRAAFPGEVAEVAQLARQTAPVWKVLQGRGGIHP